MKVSLEKENVLVHRWRLTDIDPVIISPVGVVVVIIMPECKLTRASRSYIAGAGITELILI